MRNEDEAFADIVKQEFDEQWDPATEPIHEPTPVQPAQPIQPEPLPDFHLNLYDDDESYRQVPRTAWSLSTLMSRGLALIGAGLVIALAKIIFTQIPSWIGWIAVVCFIAGTSMCVWHLTHADNHDDDEGGTV